MVLIAQMWEGLISLVVDHTEHHDERADAPPERGEVLNQQVRSADYLGMQSVTACNDTCIRGD